MLACASAEPPPAAPPIATYRDGGVSREELAGWLRFRRIGESPQNLRTEVEQMLLVKTLAAAAQQRGIDGDPALQVVLEQVENELLLGRLKRSVAAAVDIDESEVEAYLREHPDAFHRPPKVRLRNLFKRFPPDGGEEEIAAVRARMVELESELRSGADFAELARRESDSQTRFRGGLIGNVEAGQLQPVLDAVAMRLEPGATSQVLETADGLTILRCEARLEETAPSRDEALERIRSNLRRLRTGERWRQTEEELLHSAQPVYDLDRARDVETPPGAVLLRFRDGQLTRRELEGLLGQRRLGSDPSAYSPQQLHSILEQHVLRVAAARRARGLALAADPDREQRAAWRRRSILALEELEDRIQALLRPLRKVEVRGYFEAHPELFQRLPHFDLALIHFTLERSNPRPVYRRAERVLAEIRGGATAFAAAARVHSDHPSAPHGGAVGWQSRRQLVRFGRAAFETIQALDPGEVSDLVQQDLDLWIFELRGFEAARPLTFEEAAEAAENRLGSERAGELRAQIEALILERLAIRFPASAQPLPEASQSAPEGRGNADAG